MEISSSENSPVERCGLATPASGAQLLNEMPRVRVARHLRQGIMSGVYAPGEPLPPERALSERLQVNRSTLRSALEMLSEEGLLRSNGGRLRMVVEQPVKRSGLMQRTVAVLMPFNPPSLSESAVSSWWWQNSISAHVLNRIHGAGLHAMALHPEQLLGEEVGYLIADQPRGVIITDMTSQWSQTVELCHRLKNRGIANVVYGGSPGLDGQDRVTSDHAQGAYELTKFLLSEGRRRILNLWPAPADQYWFQQRRAGYERAMQEAGVEALPTAIMPPFRLSLGNKENFSAEVRFLAGHLVEYLTGTNAIDAIMLSTDRDTFAAAAACRLFGKTPNEEVAITGYDNYWSYCEERELEPAIPLATVNKRHDSLGAELVALLKERIESGSVSDAQCRIVAPELILTKL